MIHSFSCANFRNVNVHELEFGKINILIGPNESGKSNFIRAITLYSNMLKHPGDGGLDSAFLNAIKRSGWDHMRNIDASDDDPIDISWEMDLGNDSVKYYLSFLVGKKAEDCIIKEEKMDAVDERGYENPFNYFTCHTERPGNGFISTATRRGEHNSRLPFPLRSDEIFCRQYKDVFLSDNDLYQSEKRDSVLRILEKIERKFLSIRSYSGNRFDTSLMKEAVDANANSDYLFANASNFSAVFNQYKNDSVQWKKNFTERFKEMDPNVTDLDVLYNSDRLSFYVEKKGQYRFDMSDLSEGALKALIYNLLLNLPESKENFLLAIDEPENNLHPSWQKVLGQWIQNSTSFEQCFISTHSPDFLDVFTEGFKHEDVYVFVFDGFGNINRISYDNIKESLADWELGDLYRVNDPALGGWPW